MPESGNDQQSFSQRYMAFVLLSFCILMLFNPWGRPPVDQPPADPANAESPADGEANNAVAENGVAENAAPAGDAAEGAADQPDAEPIEEEPDAAPQRVALGSLTADGEYRMLATLSNTGAAVERIELSSPDFRDLDDRSGYLGELGLVKAADGAGAKVTVVGPGTPAAEAGLQVGDVITTVSIPKLHGLHKGGWQINSAAALNTLLADTKP